ACTVLESGVLGLKLVFSAEIFDLGLSDIQLRLGQLDDGREAKIVAALRQVLGQCRLTQKLSRDIDPLEGVHCAGPRDANVPRNSFLHVAQFLVGLVGPVSRGLLTCGKGMTVEYRKIEIERDTFIAIRDTWSIDIRQETGDTNQ